MKTAKCFITGIIILSCFLCLITAFAASSVQDRRQPIKKPTLTWIHKETGRKIFGLEDIIAFDWDKQMFELKEEAAMNMYLYPVGLIDPFEVRCGNEIIYEGAFVSMECSIPYKGLVIPVTYRFSETHSSLFQIVNGYPDEKYSVDYGHYTPPVKQIFSEAGVLKSLDPNQISTAIHRKHYEWMGPRDGLRLWLEVFGDTFVPDMPGRFHFRLTSPKQYPEDDYIIETRTTLTGNSGRFTRTASRVFPVSKKYLQAAHPVCLVLSRNLKDDKIEEIEPGPAALEMEIAIRRVLDSKQGRYSEPIETLKTEAVSIDILPPKRTELSPEAKTAMDDFRKALQQQDWPKALTFCSEAVKRKTANQSSQEFFETYTPLDRLTGDMEYYISGMSTNTPGQYTGFQCFMTLSKPGEQPCINWVWWLKQDRTSDAWTIDFPLVSVTEQMESEKNRLETEQRKAEERKQLLLRNMKTSLIPIQTEYVIGKPMLLRLEVTNISDTIMTLPFVSRAVMVNNPLLITGPDGKEVLYMGGSAQTAASDMEFKPDQTEILAQEYDVTSQYMIIEPGEYTICFRGSYGFPASQEVKLIVKPGKLSPKDDITAKIRSVKPDDWGLSYAGVMSGESADASSHLNLLIALNAFLYKSKYSKYSIGLSVFIDPDEKASAERSDWTGVEKVCQSPWGPVYVLSWNAELCWPDYRESLVRALNPPKE